MDKTNDRSDEETPHSSSRKLSLLEGAFSSSMLLQKPSMLLPSSSRRTTIIIGAVDEAIPRRRRESFGEREEDSREFFFLETETPLSDHDRETVDQLSTAVQTQDRKRLTELLESQEKDADLLQQLLYGVRFEDDTTLAAKAAAAGWREGVEDMISATLDVPEVQRKRKSFLHWAVISELDRNVVEVLLPESVDVLDNEKRTPLHYASETGNLELMRLFLERGANIDAADESELTPLHLAAREGQVDAILLLVMSGAEVNQRPSLPPQELPARMDIRAKPPPTAAWAERFSPLQLAARQGHRAAVRALLQAGARLDATASYFLTDTMPDLLEEMFDKCVTGKNAGKVKDEQLDIHSASCVLEMDVTALIPDQQFGRMAKVFRTESFLLQHMAGQARVLQHPLVEAFVELKWYLLRKYVYAYLLASLLFIALFATYIAVFLRLDLAAAVASGGTRVARPEENGDVWTAWAALLASALAIVVLETLRVVFSNQRCTWDVEYPLDFALLAAVPLLVPVFAQRQVWQTALCAFSAVFLSLKFVFVLGKIPVISVYVMVFRRVSAIMMGMVLVFSWIIVGFGVAFQIVLSHGEADEQKPLYVHLMKILTMVIGQVDIDGLFYQPNRVFHTAIGIIFLAYVFLVFVIILNVVMGIPIYDIQTLLRESRRLCLSHQVQLLQQFEAIILHARCSIRSFKEDVTMFPDMLSDLVIRVAPNEKKRNALGFFVFPFFKQREESRRSTIVRIQKYYEQFLAAGEKPTYACSFMKKQTLESLKALAFKNFKNMRGNTKRIARRSESAISNGSQKPSAQVLKMFKKSGEMPSTESRMKAEELLLHASERVRILLNVLLANLREDLIRSAEATGERFAGALKGHEHELEQAKEGITRKIQETEAKLNEVLRMVFHHASQPKLDQQQ